MVINKTYEGKIVSKIYDLLGKLEKVKGKHPKWMALCPVHGDKSPSLSIKETDDGRILLYCFAGCGAADIVSTIGLSLADLSPSGKLGNFLPGNKFRHREPEAVYGVPGANRMAESLRAKDREIEALKAKLLCS